MIERDPMRQENQELDSGIFGVLAARIWLGAKCTRIESTCKMGQMNTHTHTHTHTH